jgi:hypothetical protein
VRIWCIACVVSYEANACAILRALAHGSLLANPASVCRTFELSNGRELDLAVETR